MAFIRPRHYVDFVAVTHARAPDSFILITLCTYVRKYYNGSVVFRSVFLQRVRSPISITPEGPKNKYTTSYITADVKKKK